MNILRDWRDFGIVGGMTHLQAVTLLAALAQESRLAIYRLLVQNAPDGLTVGVIAESLDLPAPTLSFHIKTLAHAGLVQTVQEGRYVRCRAELSQIDAMIAYLTENCCGGNPEACPPRAQR
ncbi:MAG TPA: metalloregulator ArsR/SmtB family transcription factor [Accumulibacter sp.]|nr:metalloregulator ArsR/SmtB family transcription factor [Accumulibacter sp.]HMW17648.1 metalloregulator ArsR/SmtB family transcription factor [Accumulibacter sp.]HMX23608.1 metalloregulator ArsR/SmtB family transcription factor [Accumulibacter sp.]HMY07349.1 metalloregulator ArsR/SmtB family transcription factor [Accumulibacter sp.]HNC16550.1 metalloregulator ArsR/SmtB family transcription factor [Accumulibacter sp.]